MADNESWLQNKNDTSNISINIKKHIKHGRHRTKYIFNDDSTDTTNSNIQVYTGTDHIQLLYAYVEEMKLGEIEFNVFRCQSKSKIPAFYANITLGSVSLASSFPEKYSLPDVAKQVAARKALDLLKKNNSCINIPVTEDNDVIVERLEKELQKNYAGLFCDKIEIIYKELYNESLPSDWLSRINQLTTHIMIEHLPKQNKSILYYDSSDLKSNIYSDEFVITSVTETCNNLPLMKFVDKTERTIIVASIDSNHTIWLRFVQDKINDDYNALFKLMNMPDETLYFSKMFSIEIFDVYAIQINSEWHRFQVYKIENDIVTGVLIDVGVEFIVDKNDIMFLPQKFLNVPSQAIKCALTSLFFAPYFEVAKQIFDEMLFSKEFTVVPDNIDSDVQLVTLYNGKCNMNSLVMEAIVEETSFNKINKTCEKCNLSYIADGYVYLHPPNDTLFVMESILDTISCSRPLEHLYSKKSISPHKLYLVKCVELNMWSRAIIDDFIFTEQKFKVFFVDYGNYGVIDQDKFIELQSIDLLLAVIPHQALKVSVHLFPPEKLNESRSRALNEMMYDKPLDVEVILTNSDGIQVVEIYDGNDPSLNRISYNAQLYQSKMNNWCFHGNIQNKSKKKALIGSFLHTFIRKHAIFN